MTAETKIEIIDEAVIEIRDKDGNLRERSVIKEGE